jgi:monothiol glutaredoxin|tara:strand:- start:918 stop:1298 length:381 start_codon:yes stop_codon:yes gene_type:complete
MIEMDNMDENNPVFDRIRNTISESEVVLFMKGTPVFPQCGFSALAVQVMGLLGVKFKGINVLEDPEIRDGIKSFSDWPTIPQLYVKGEFVGGSDIIKEMYESGEIQSFFESKNINLNPENNQNEGS